MPEITLSSNTCRSRSTVQASIGVRSIFPALETSASSRPPPCCTAWATISCRSESLVTSPASQEQLLPMLSATAFTFSIRRPVMVTRAPPLASRRAVASPIPDPPPVMRTDMLSRAFITRNPSFCQLINRPRPGSLDGPRIVICCNSTSCLFGQLWPSNTRWTGEERHQGLSQSAVDKQRLSGYVCRLV